ncbi:hypothetical protein [Epilithonimonas sp. JDS]|nr:hypothetical protein [Epilithonimonas sp. JDS]
MGTASFFLVASATLRHREKDIVDSGLETWNEGRNVMLLNKKNE